MNTVKYNFNQTHDFLPEISSEEIIPNINGNKFGRITENRRVINISVRIKNSSSSQSTKKGQKNHIENNQFSLKRRASSFHLNHNEKYFKLNESITNTELLIPNEKKSSSASSTIFHKNAICVLFIEDSKGRREYARTEVIWNQDEPNWVKSFTLEISQEVKEVLNFEIYEVVSSNRNIEQQKYLANSTVDLKVLLQSYDHYVQAPILAQNTNETSAYLDINFYELKPNVEGSYIFCFRANEFNSPTRIIKSPRPYFIIKRVNECSNHYMNVYKSEVVKHLQNKTAEWNNVCLNLQALCGGDLDLPLRIALHDYMSTKHVNNKNGFIDTTLRRLIENKNFDFIDNSGKVTAHFHVELLSKIEKPCYFDFKLKGMKIHPILAVDFSGTKINYVDSNRFLHFDNGPFSYVAAISEVYDSLHQLVQGQSFTGYAFADFKGSKVVPLLGDFKKENIANKVKMQNIRDVGSYNPRSRIIKPIQDENNERITCNSSIKSIIDCYNYTKHHITYPEHSLLEPLVVKAIKDAQSRFQNDGTISLLVVVANGVFKDLQKAINKLVEASNAPLITLFVLMYGMRMDIYDNIVRRNGKLVDGLGNKPNRKLAEVVIYSDGNMFCEQRMDSEVVPSIEQMATEYFRSI